MQCKSGNFDPSPQDEEAGGHSGARLLHSETLTQKDLILSQQINFWKVGNHEECVCVYKEATGLRGFC